MQTDHRCAMTSISNGDWTIEVAMRCDDQKRFKVLPCRWVVEHTFAWLGRFHRLTKDCEKSIQSSNCMDSHRPYTHPNAASGKVLG